MILDDTPDSVTACIAAFEQQHVLVLGDAIVDEYLYGDCSRISPEAPVPVLRVTRMRQVLGGAANTAANVVSLGARATLISLAGQDDGGATLRKCALDAGINLCAIDSGRPTLRKTRVVGQNQQLVRLDYEDVHALTPAIEAKVFEAFEAHLGLCDIVVISDYAKGLISPSLMHEVVRRAHERGLSIVVDPRPQHRECYIGCDYLTPNWKEARALLGLTDADPTPENVDDVARTLASQLRTNVVLTLGPHGIAFCSRNGGEVFSQPTLAREVYDVSGAGDTVVAAFSLARACGTDHGTAVALANRAASVVVGKFGTATVSREDILQDSDSRRLVSRRQLAPLAATLRAKGKRVVTVNGSFDVLHSGHLYILNEARRCGDVLIVGLNSDASVRGYKGPQRPIIGERQRAEMLLAMRIVDYVHIFDESDPIAFLDEVKPDVHVNGAEYGQTCVESDTVRRHGGTLHLVDRIPGLSTSGVVDALQRSGA
jgi:D-beta-D-heptose 7-phosphate kinase/D-beta-D-heptose 1-phosphate adenosyltransferase